MKRVNPRWESAPFAFGFVVDSSVNHSLVKGPSGLLIAPDQPELRADKSGNHIPPFIEEQPDGTTREVW